MVKRQEMGRGGGSRLWEAARRKYGKAALLTLHSIIHFPSCTSSVDLTFINNLNSSLSSSVIMLFTMVCGQLVTAFDVVLSEGKNTSWRKELLSEPHLFLLNSFLHFTSFNIKQFCQLKICENFPCKTFLSSSLPPWWRELFHLQAGHPSKWFFVFGILSCTRPGQRPLGTPLRVLDWPQMQQQECEAVNCG